MKILYSTYIVSLGIIFSLIISMRLNAQEGTISLADCIEKAISDNSSFGIIENMERINLQRKKILTTGLFPDISASSDLNQFVQNSTVAFTNDILPQSEIKGARTNNSNASISSSLNLNSIGKSVSEIKAWRHLDESDRQLNVQEKNKIIQLICQSYFDCLLNDKLEKIINNKISWSEKAIEITKRKVAIGEADSTEYYQAMINLKQDLYTKNQVVFLQVEALSNLKTLVGLDHHSRIKLDTNLLTKIEDVQFNVRRNFNPDLSPQLLALENDLSESEIRKKGVSWDMLPNLSIFSGYGYSNQTFQNGIVRQNTALGFSYGISINYRFGDLKNAMHQRKIFDIQSKNVSLQIEELGKNLLDEFNLLLLRQEEIKQSINTNKSIYKMTKRNLQNSLVGYELGSITLTDLRLSQDQFLNSSVELNTSKVSLFTSTLEILALSENLEESLIKVIK